MREIRDQFLRQLANLPPDLSRKNLRRCSDLCLQFLREIWPDFQLASLLDQQVGRGRYLVFPIVRLPVQSELDVGIGPVNQPVSALAPVVWLLDALRI